MKAFKSTIYFLSQTKFSSIRALAAVKNYNALQTAMKHAHI
jgi:hypothetical protein